MLQNDESRHIIHLVKDDTSSLLWLRDKDSCLSRQSVASENSNMLDVSFEFDREVFNSKAYQVAIRSALSRNQGKMPQRQEPLLNDAIGVLGYGRSIETEDDAQIFRRKSVNPWPLNDAIDVVGYERSNETEDDAQTIRSKSVNTSSLNDVTGFVGYGCSNEIEDDAQTIGGKSVGPWPLNDAIPNGIIKKPSQADDTIFVTSIVEHSTSPRLSLAASNMHEERGDKKDPPTGKRLPVPKDLSPLNTMSLDRAVVSSSQDSSKLPKKGGHISMSSKDINSQPSLSPVALRYFQTSQVPSEAAHTALIGNRECRKVLILGTSGAGKSTLLKSMTICCGGSYSRIEREMYQGLICRNLIEDMRMILDVMMTLDIDLAEDNRNHATTVYATDFISLNPDELPDDVALAIKALWDDSGVQTGFRGLSGGQLNDSCG